MRHIGVRPFDEGMSESSRFTSIVFVCGIFVMRIFSMIVCSFPRWNCLVRVVSVVQVYNQLIHTNQSDRYSSIDNRSIVRNHPPIHRNVHELDYRRLGLRLPHRLNVEPSYRRLRFSFPQKMDWSIYPEQKKIRFVASRCVKDLLWLFGRVHVVHMSTSFHVNIVPIRNRLDSQVEVIKGYCLSYKNL